MKYMEKEKQNVFVVVTKMGQMIKLHPLELLSDMSKSIVSGEKFSFIKLAKGDKIITTFVCEEDCPIFCATEGKWGFKFKLSDIRIMRAGGSGVSFMRLTPTSGSIKFVAASWDDRFSGVERKYGTINGGLKISLKTVPLLKRGSRGIKLLK